MNQRIRVFVSLFLLMVIWPLVVYAATRNAISDGNWTDTGSWFGGNVPISTDDATANANVDLTIQNGETVEVVSFNPGANGSLTIDAGGQITFNNPGLTGFLVSSNYTLTVDGTLIINGDLVVSNLLTLNVSGDIIINGDVILGNSASLDVTGTGTITIDGDFSGGNSTSVNVDLDGSIDVSGDVDVGNGSTLTGDGVFTAGGTCTGDTDFCNSSTLPVELLFFKATPWNELVRLEWATFQQENFDYFCLERSSNGIDYLCLSEIDGEEWTYGITHYTFDDIYPLAGRSYYRLKAVDIDGSFEYHPIVTIGLLQADRDFWIYPNPSEDGKVTLSLNFVPDEFVEVSITDLQGRRLFSQNVNTFRKEFTIDPSIGSGIYLVRIRSGSLIDTTRRLLVD